MIAIGIVVTLPSTAASSPPAPPRGGRLRKTADVGGFPRLRRGECAACFHSWASGERDEGGGAGAGSPEWDGIRAVGALSWAEGAQVVIAGRRREPLDEAVREVENQRPRRRRTADVARSRRLAPG